MTGKAVFGIDAIMPNMLYACIERAPVLGSNVTNVDDSAGKAGQRSPADRHARCGEASLWIQASGRCRCDCDNSWAAMQGRKSLKIEWSASEHDKYESAAYKKQLIETAKKPGRVAREIGNVDAEFDKGGKIVEASYYTPMLAHAADGASGGSRRLSGR